MIISSFVTRTDNTQIKVIDSYSSRNKLYSTFVVYSKTSNLVHISDRHNYTWFLVEKYMVHRQNYGSLLKRLN